MIRACTIMMVLSTTICSISAYAEKTTASPDVYNQCVEQTIEKLALGNINNAVVESCSNQSRAYYEKEIVTYEFVYDARSIICCKLSIYSYFFARTPS